MAINKYHKLKRCRFLELDPAAIGSGKKSIRTSGRKTRKVSEYGIQLREKQRAKFIYCVNEKQFRKYYEMADRKKGVTGENMLIILESRLDNVVYRMGIATTRQQARQLVAHEQFTVNGQKVNVPSYLVKAGDVIAVRENKKNNKYFTAVKEAKPVFNIPKWVEFDHEKLEGKVLALPKREEIDTQIAEHMIVELYSK
jgi:small subunit ribosomal protein S4